MKSKFATCYKVPILQCIISDPQSKNAVSVISDHMQSTFFYLGKFLKRWADDQSSSITKEGIILYQAYVQYNLLVWKWLDEKFDIK